MITTIPVYSFFSFLMYLQIYLIKQPGMEQPERSRRVICEDVHNCLLGRLQLTKHEQ